LCNLHYEKFADGTVKCIEDEIPFELPEGWVWCRLQTICEKEIKRGKAPKYVEKSGTLVFAQKCNTKKGKINITLAQYLDESTLHKYSPDLFTRYNDIIINSTGTGTLGRIGIFEESDDLIKLPIVPDSHITTVRAFSINVAKYVYLFLKANQPYFEDSGEGSTNQKELRPEVIKTFLIAIPPYKEQAKIVEKFEAVCTIIDLLDAYTEDYNQAIKSIKSKILDLAIRGKLVPQNPDDEPASVLLERIRAEKEELIKQGKIKRDKKESIIFKGEDNSYYVRSGEQVEDIVAWELDDLPESWGICALGEICDYGSCTNVETDQISDDEWILDLEDIEKDSGKVLCKVRKLERNAVSTKHKFLEGQVLYSKLRPYLNKVVLADEDGYCTSEILPLDFSEIIVPAYARYYLMSSTFLKYADRCSYGVKMPRLSTTDGKKAVFTVPPINEQHRIVSAIQTAFYQLETIAESLN